MKKHRLLLLCLLFSQLSPMILIHADQPVRVGIYQNEPLVFTDADGNVEGIYIDVLDYVAAEEGWRVQYVPGTWPECLERLEDGEIDLLVGIAYSTERDQRYDFTDETLLSNWGQVYARSNAGLASILDLEDQTVAVLTGDVYYNQLRPTLQSFGVECDFVEVDTYAAALQLVDGGEADAALITRLYGLQHEREYAVERSPIICCPVELRFAVPERHNQELTAALDRHLVALKDEQGSAYYQSLNRWLGGFGQPSFPTWVIWPLVITATLALIFLAGSIVLRAQVRARTGELEQEVAERARAEEALERRAIQMATLNHIGRHVTSIFDQQALLQQAVDAVQEDLGYLQAAVLLVSEEAHELHVAAATDNFWDVIPDGYRQPVGEGAIGLAAETGETILVKEASTNFRPYQSGAWFSPSSLSVPIQMGAWVIGVLEVEADVPNAFDDDDQATMETLADQIAVALENARLYATIEQRQRYLEGVLDAAPDAIVALNMRNRIMAWNSGAEKLFGYSQEQAIGEDVDDLITGPDVLQEAAGFTRKVMSGGEVEPTETVRYREDGSPVDVIVAGSPVTVDDKLIGAVAVYTDITERKRAEEALRRRADELATLQATVLDITARHDLSTLLYAIVERATHLLDAPSGGMYLCDPQRGEAHCVVSYNTPEDYTGTTLDYGEGAAGTVAEIGEPLIIDDYRIWSGRAATYEEDQPFTAVLSAPMIWQGEVTGVIHLLHDVKTRRFKQADLELLTLFANHAAIAVANARLYEEISKHAAQLEALRGVGLNIAAQLDLDALLDSIASQAIELLKGVAGGLYIYRPERDVLEFVTAVGRESVAVGSVLRRGEGLSGRVWEAGEPLTVDDYRQWAGQAPQYEGLPIAAVVGVPIRWGDEFLGVLTTEGSASRTFSAADAELLSLFATQAAIAIRNARLYEQAQREISERKRAEEALRESEARYRTLFNSASDAIFIHDPEGSFVQVNDVACERLAYSREELLRMGLGDITVQEDEGEVPDPFAALSGGDTLYLETVHIRRDGTEIPVELSSRLVQYGDEEAILTIARDITERKEMEEQLRQQERLAAVGQLAGGIAHDFNNILASIILYAQMPLRGGGLAPATQDALETILEESHRAADLIQQILDFSRRAMMETEPVSLVSLAEDALALLRRTIPENVRLTAQLTSHPCTVQADATRIHQVLMNLALNAKDAMPKGGKLCIQVDRVCVGADGEPGSTSHARPPDMAPGAWARLTISDTGAGMSKEVQDHLFEPFFTTKEEGKGTGLGLAQVYGIVKQHQGFIDVETAVDEGTTFTIFLPLVEDDDEEQAAERESTQRGRGETILVVEDAQRLRRAIEIGLEASGYHVITATNGREALEIVSQQDVDLVLTDVIMPEMGGEALLRSLRAEYPHLNVIAMTGHIVDTRIEELQDAGFADALAKPFSMGELTRIVRTVLDG